MAHKVDRVSGVCGGIRFCVNIESTRMGTTDCADCADYADCADGGQGKGGEGKR